ncbi:MAG: 3-phosphoshikimate 1-carboxyvinyltransferase [Bacteroidota bacterium]
MKVEFSPSLVEGTIYAPASKSIAQRYVAAALLASGETTIRHYPNSEDPFYARKMAESLGATVWMSKNTLTIKGGFPNNHLHGIRAPQSELFAGESGFAARLFLPIAALHDGEKKMDGAGTLLNRPFEQSRYYLEPFGVSVNTSNGKLPVTTLGQLKGGEAELSAEQSSQFLSGLLMALPRCTSDSKITLSVVNSRPYIDLTIAVMNLFGVTVKENDQTFIIKGGQRYKPQEVSVDGDWSGAVVLLIIGALCAENGLLVRDINLNLPQADQAILQIFDRAKVDYTLNENSVKVFASQIQAFDFDATQCPDLIPCVAAMAAFGNGISTIKGARRLVVKESNRAGAIVEEFAKSGIRVVLRGDDLIVYPGHARPAIWNSHKDHRMVMAAAVFGLAGAKTMVQNADCISKSYPDFYQDLQHVGARIRF